MDMGGYYVKTPDSGMEEWAGYLTYPLNRAFKIKANLLNRNSYTENRNNLPGTGRQNDQIWGLQLKLFPAERMKMAFEYAREIEEKCGQAFKADLSGAYERINYFMNLLYGDRNYHGEFQNTLAGRINLNISLKDNFFIWGEYQQLQENLATDPFLGGAPRQKFNTVGLTYKQKQNSYFFLSHTGLVKEDLLPFPQPELTADKIRVSYSKNFKNIYLGTYYEWGKEPLIIPISISFSSPL